MTDPVEALERKWLAILTSHFKSRNFKHPEDAAYNALHNGRGHIVWDDYNLEDHHIKWCIEEASVDHLREFIWYGPEVDKIVIQSLQDLLTIPEVERLSEPLDKVAAQVNALLKDCTPKERTDIIANINYCRHCGHETCGGMCENDE